MKKVFNIIFIFVFIFIIIFPNLHFTKSDVSTTENRNLAPYKGLFSEGQMNFTYGKDFENYYNDHFFMRETFVKIYQKFFEEFKSNVNDNVRIGTDGWSFYRKDNGEANYANIVYFSENELKQILDKLQKIQNWCDANGKTFVYFIAPDKNKIYGEHYSKKVPKVNPDTQSRAFQLINFLKENSTIKVLYPYEELLKEKEQGYPLYYKNDTHWNLLGGYIGYKTICNALNIEPLKISQYEDITNECGDLTSMFPEKMKPDTDTIYHIPIVENNYISEYKNDVASQKEHIHTENKNLNPTSKNLFVLRDSFTGYLHPFFSNTFNIVDYHWRYSFTENDLKELTNADVIILENVERFSFHIPNISIPSYMN